MGSGLFCLVAFGGGFSFDDSGRCRFFNRWACSKDPALSHLAAIWDDRSDRSGECCCLWLSVCMVAFFCLGVSLYGLLFGDAWFFLVDGFIIIGDQVDGWSKVNFWLEWESMEEGLGLC